MLVFTDGDDTASRKDAGDVIERARVEEMMVYAIGLETEYFIDQSACARQPDRGLRRVSDETGGGFFMLKKQDELGTDVHARRAGASQSVRAWVSAPRSRRQGPQARSEDQAAGHGCPRPPQLRRRGAVDAGRQAAIIAALVAAAATQTSQIRYLSR